jgi:large subunit ribosomal protein L4
VFGPKPRIFATDLPRKIRDFALRVALSAKRTQDQLLIVNTTSNFSSSKTKDFEKLLALNQWSAPLIVTGQATPKSVELASRNIKEVKTLEVKDLNVYSILWHKHVVLDVDAVKWLERRLFID